MEEEKEEKEEEKFPLCESIVHRPLRGRCPKIGSLGSRIARGYSKSYDRVLLDFFTDLLLVSDSRLY